MIVQRYGKYVFKWCLLVLSLLILTRWGVAEERRLLIDGERVTIGQSKEFGFGTVPQAGTTVLLKITSRLDSKKQDGSSHFLKVELNGHTVTAAKGRNAVRLVNKSLNSPVTPNISGSWYSENSGWRVVYAPDFQAAAKQSFYEGDPYTVVLDVTDLTNPVAENRLKITNTATEAIKKFTSTDAELVIDRLEIETRPQPSPMMTVETAGDVINRGEPAAGPAQYRGEVLPGGGFSVTVGQNTLRFSSAFSFPNAGFNYLSAGEVDRRGQAQWKVRRGNGQDEIIAQGPQYRVERKIMFRAQRVEIADTIKNLSVDAPLGMAVRHEMDTSSLEHPQIRIAGSLDPAVNNYYAPGNPSVHVTTPFGGLGIIAEDDVLRNQARMYTNENSPDGEGVTGIRTDMLRLGPGESETLRWAVYPVAGPDYYDFINAVRKDWRANFTVNGGVWWMSQGVHHPATILKMSQDDLRETLLKNGIRYVMLTGSWAVSRKDQPALLAFGTAVFDEEYADFRKQVLEAADKIRKAVPGTKVLGYYDVQRDSSHESLKKFSDSWLTDATGKQLSTDWGGRYTWSYNMVPTLDNNFGKAAVELAERYIDDLKMDGVYWDEVELVAFNSPLITYNRQDGRSCILNPKTWTIQKEVALIPLISSSFRKAAIQAVQKKGGEWLGNGPTGSLNEMQMGIPRMVEIQHNDIFAYQGHLQTPLGFQAAGYSWENFLRAFKFGMLPISLLPITKYGDKQLYSHEIMPHLFPFTPIELHAGYLLGQERIIATHSGNYGWHGQKTLFKTWHFNSQGKLTQRDFAIAISSKGARSQIELGEKEAIVLERLPLSFEVNRGEVRVSDIYYDQDNVTLRVETPQGGVLVLNNGKFALKADSAITLQMGDATRRPVKVTEQTLRFPVEAGFSGVIRIQK